MNRTDFGAFCAAHNLAVENAGSDWYRADFHGDFMCAVINDEKDFAAVKSLLDNNAAYLASAVRKDGNTCFEYRGGGKIYADDANDVAHKMADQFVRFLDSNHDISYYSAEDIARRDKALSDNPAIGDESEDAHFERVAEKQDDALAPLHVSEPGYWSFSSSDLILSAISARAGLWSYCYDNWEERVILILDETEANRN